MSSVETFRCAMERKSGRAGHVCKEQCPSCREWWPPKLIAGTSDPTPDAGTTPPALEQSHDQAT